jgi:hypothetical protein
MKGFDRFVGKSKKVGFLLVSHDQLINEAVIPERSGLYHSSGNNDHRAKLAVLCEVNIPPQRPLNAVLLDSMTGQPDV